MSRDEWYRRSTWTERDREEFNARLKRSRSSKAQYLRIQAFHLAEAHHHSAAIELLDRIFADFPERTEMACAHQQKAECLARLGQDDAAVEEFRAALQTERSFPNRRTSAWLDFGCFIVEKRRTELYGEVECVLNEFSAAWHLPLPVERYRYLGILAYVAAEKGMMAEARDFAREALAEAAKQHSGLRYHPKLGLVENVDSQFARGLAALAAESVRDS